MKKLPLLLLLLLPSLTFASPKPIHWQTPQGMAVYFLEDHQQPLIDIAVTFGAGSAFDGKQFGLAALTNQLIGEGSLYLSADEMAQSFDNLAVRLDKRVDKDKAVVHLRTLSDKPVRSGAMNLFVEAVSEPSFSSGPVNRLKQTQLAQIQQREQSPSQRAFDHFFQNLYPKHPYGHHRLGTPQTVSALTEKQVQQFFSHHYNAANAALIIIGDLTKKQAQQFAKQLSLALPAGKHLTLAQPVPKLKASKIVKVDHPSKQTHIVLGNHAIEKGHAHFHPLAIANHILGNNGLISRLAQVIREQHGLAYSVYSAHLPLQQPGPWFVNLQTRNTQADKALALTKQALKTYAEKGPTEKEITQAKQQLIHRYHVQLDSNKAILNTLIEIGFYRLPLAWFTDYAQKIAAVTPAQVTQVINRYLQPDPVVIIQLGPKT